MEIIRKLMNKVKQLLNGEVYYVNGPDTLPPPLTHEEEEAVFAALSRKDVQARNTLIVRNLRLVVYIAKKFESTGIGTEDLVSIGTIGLIKAVNTFCPEKNIKLATYASRCIENEILMFLRKSSQYRGDLSIDEPLNTDCDGNELLLSDVIGTEDDIVSKGIETEAERELLRSAVSELCEREREIMELRFGLIDGKEKTQKETAELIGISQSYISRLEKKIIRKLRTKLEKALL
ncbi:MAG: RNA polymerase sporulation sigma factor SigE [Ruminococcus sp.]|nr:RNA polymerase sporulation sigma factor SigE [Ruminococcus sp.]